MARRSGGWDSSLVSLAPLFRGRDEQSSLLKGQGEGLYPSIRLAESPPHPALRADLSPRRGEIREEPLPLHILLFRRGGGLAGAGADHANRVAIGETIGRRGDDAVVGGKARGDFNLFA
jgi:hypothetical protein